MGIIKQNITANFIGSVWTALISIIFVPLYIKFLGIESWGIIGIFMTLQAVFTIFDLGLSAALMRELSRLSVIPGREHEMRNLVRSMEVVYWGIALSMGLLVMLISHYIAYSWVKPGHLSRISIQTSLMIMGFAMAIQWPVSLYNGGLIGLQKQVTQNWINICISTLRGLGAVMILWLVSPTIIAFFCWQIVVSTFHMLLSRWTLWRSLPHSPEITRFRKHLIAGISRFAAGMSGITILGMILTQVDKVMLSRILSLEQFGYYTLASSVALSLTRLFSPVFFSIYPRFTQYVACNDISGLTRFYHKCAQFMSLLIIPVSVILILFSREILIIWIHNENTVRQTYLLVSILIAGTALNGIMNPPLALQYAYGRTRLAFSANLVSVIIIIPSIYFFARNYGASGAALCWFLMNLAMFFTIIPIMHKRLLSGEQWQWYFKDVAIPFIAAIAVSFPGRLFLAENSPKIMIFIFLAIISSVTFAVTLLSLRDMRANVKGLIHYVKLYERS